MAVLLNSPLLKARGLYRFAFFAPVVVGEVAYSAVFRLMFSLDFGIVNKLLNSVGLPKVDWFSNVTPAMYTMNQPSSNKPSTATTMFAARYRARKRS